MWGSPSGKGYMQKEPSRGPICHGLGGRPLYLGSHRLGPLSKFGKKESLVRGKMLGCTRVQASDMREGHLYHVTSCVVYGRHGISTPYNAYAMAKPTEAILPRVRPVAIYNYIHLSSFLLARP